MNIKINSRMLLSVASIGAAAALIIGATFAFFSDTETSTGNTFAAGELDLRVDSECHYFQNNVDIGCGSGASFGNWAESDLTPGVHTFFNFNDIKPGDRGENTISLHVYDNDAWGRFVIRDVVDNDEGEDGGLRDALLFNVWLDEGLTNGFQCSPNPGQPGDDECTADPTEGDNVKQDTEPTLISEGTVDEQGESHNIYDGLAAAYSSNGCSGNGALNEGCPGLAPDGRMIGSITYFFGLAWKLPEETGNEVQGDSLSATLEFQVAQHRNNPSKDGFVEGEGLLVGAALGDYVAPTVCSDTVSGSESIQASEDAAVPGATICVDTTYDGAGDNTAIRIETTGVTLAATVRGVNLDVPVTLSASNVTVTGFDGVIGQAASPAEQAAFYVEGDGDLFEISFNTVTGGVGAAILTETGGALGGGLIANNELSGATQGIYTNPHTGVFIIEYNDIDNNAAGIGGLMGATVRNNEFEHTVAGSEAIGVDPTHDANPATVNFNNFLNGTKLNTYTGIVGDVSAENNFWGPSGGAAQTGGTDEVDFTPEAGVAYAHN